MKAKDVQFTLGEYEEALRSVASIEDDELADLLVSLRQHLELVPPPVPEVEKPSRYHFVQAARKASEYFEQWHHKKSKGHPRRQVRQTIKYWATRTGKNPGAAYVILYEEFERRYGVPINKLRTYGTNQKTGLDVVASKRMMPELLKLAKELFS